MSILQFMHLISMHFWIYLGSSGRTFGNACINSYLKEGPVHFCLYPVAKLVMRLLIHESTL